MNVNEKSPVLLNWSSGKDSALALHRLYHSGEYEVRQLLTTVNEHYRRVSQHGVRIQLLEQQAESLGLPLHKTGLPKSVDMESYSALMKENLTEFKQKGITHAAYGDIHLERMRNYREKKLSELGMKGIFPLWRQNTARLARKFIEDGFRARVVCVSEEYLDRSFAGRDFDFEFLEDLPESVDPCGENGEFHTFVWDGPLFRSPVSFQVGETVYRGTEEEQSDDPQAHRCPLDSDHQTVHSQPSENGLWFTDLLLESS